MESINESLFAHNFPNKGNHVLRFGIEGLPENFDYLIRSRKDQFNTILFTKDKIGVIELYWNHEEPRCITIDYIWIDSNQRINGYTKALLDVAEQFATNIGLHQIRIHTETKAQKEYVTKLGYTEISSCENKDSGYSFSLLKKNLNQRSITKIKILESL